jgi:hypothetical protein
MQRKSAPSGRLRFENQERRQAPVADWKSSTKIRPRT